MAKPETDDRPGARDVVGHRGAEQILWTRKGPPLTHWKQKV